MRAGDVAAGELGHEQGSGPGIHAEVAIDRRRGDARELTPQAVDGVGRERVGDPTAGVVDEDRHLPELRFGLVEEPGGDVVRREIGLDGDGRPGNGSMAASTAPASAAR